MNLNAALPPAPSCLVQDDEDAGAAAGKEAPTSFAGLHLSASRASLGRARGWGSGLLSMLHTKEGKQRDTLGLLAAEVDGSAAASEASGHMKAIMQSKKRAVRR